MKHNMLGSIHQVLSHLGIDFNKAHRPLQLTFGDPHLNEHFYLQFVCGHTAINEGLELKLLCLSTSAYLPLKDFIGQVATIEQTTDQGLLHQLTGMITQAASGHHDGGFALYQLTLQDSFSSLLAKRRNSRVFMQKSVLEITQILSQEWQQHSALFAKSFIFDHGQLKHPFDTRPFTMQSQETDYAFLTRLWRSEGINWFIDSAEAGQHRLVLFNDNNSLWQLPLSTIHFHRSDATEQQDTMTALVATRQLQSSQIHVQRWNPQHGTTEEHQQPGIRQQSKAYPSASLNLEQTWSIGHAAWGDLANQDQNTLPCQQQLVRLGELLIQRQELESKSFSATASVRDVKVGYWFSLDGHAEIDQHPASEREFLITELSLYARNNLPKEMNSRVLALLALSPWNDYLNEYNQALPHQAQMTLVRRDVAVVPYYDPLNHCGKAYPMRARVVGPSTDVVHVDAWGRIKVQFLFSRAQDNTHSGGAGSSGTDSDSAWVDVLTPWAGADESSYGVRFLPRVGELVVVDFFDGNCDRPFVVGRIHEGSRPPAQFDHQGVLPDTRHLSGIKTQEISGPGFNQLRLDDTTGQISAQLQSSHGASQLNLGNLIHPRSKEEAESRGEGFELRTDMAGAIRSKGLYLSTFIQNTANGSQLDISEALEQASTSLTSMKALSEYAQKQQAEPADMLATLEAYIQKIENQWSDLKAMKDAIMLMAAPQSIAVTAGQDIHLQALAGMTIGSGQSINTSADENWILNAKKKVSLFAGQDSFKLYAAKGKFDIQAQDNTVDITARQHVKITSTEDEVHINADKAIVLTAQGSQIRIDTDGITVITPKAFKAKAAQHLFEGGSKVNLPLPFFPQNICWECLAKRALQRSAFINKGDGT